MQATDAGSSSGVSFSSVRRWAPIITLFLSRETLKWIEGNGK